MTTSNDVPPPPSPSPPPLAGEDDGDDDDGRTRRSSSNSSGALATTADDDAGRRDGFVFLDMIIVMDCSPFLPPPPKTKSTLPLPSLELAGPAGGGRFPVFIV